MQIYKNRCFASAGAVLSQHPYNKMLLEVELKCIDDWVYDTEVGILYVLTDRGIREIFDPGFNDKIMNAFDSGKRPVPDYIENRAREEMIA